MPSPRKRRLRRAIASVLHRHGEEKKIHKLSDNQKDAAFITNLVNSCDAKLLPHEGGRAYFTGGQATVQAQSVEFSVIGSRKISKDIQVKGMGDAIAWISEMDMQATATIGIEDKGTADDSIELTDGKGKTIKIVSVADGAEAPAEGSEILDAHGHHKSPLEYATIIEAADDGAARAGKLKAIIEANLDMEVIEGEEDAGTMDLNLCQLTAGPSGNTAITLALTNAAHITNDPHGAFTGGASVLDAKHYLAEDCPQGPAFPGPNPNDQTRNTLDIIVEHGLLWLDNPHHSRKAVVQANGTDGALGGVGVKPGVFDGVEDAWQSGAQADRLHYKVLSVGGALAASKNMDTEDNDGDGALPLNQDFTGFAEDNNASDSDVDGNIAKVQKVLEGNTRLFIRPSDMGNIDKDGDLFANKAACGALVHWMLVRAPA